MRLVSFRDQDGAERVGRLEGDRVMAARDRAGVTKVTFHGLRHTIGTRMAMAGEPLVAIKEWMGHASTQTTEIYSAYQPREDEASRVDRAFDVLRPLSSPAQEQLPVR